MALTEEQVHRIEIDETGKLWLITSFKIYRDGELINAKDRDAKRQQITPDNDPADLPDVCSAVGRSIFTPTAIDDFYDELVGRSDDTDAHTRINARRAPAKARWS